MTEFSQKLNALLDSQSEKPVMIAKLAGLNPDDISKYKRGKRFPENKERIATLLSAIRCSKNACNDVMEAWMQEYMSRKYKEKDAWNCIEEIYKFLQRESLTSEICFCKKDISSLEPGGVIYGELNVRRYLEILLNNDQKCEIKICGNEDFAESLSHISYSKEIQYLHVIHSKSAGSMSKWIHTVCGMLLRMIDCPQYNPLIVYGNNKWAGQLFSGTVISEHEAFLVSEDAQQGIILKNADQIKFINHYFTKMSENGKKIAVSVEQGEWYKTADGCDNEIFVQNWIEVDHLSGKKGTYYITTDAISSFIANGKYWDCHKDEWNQYKTKTGKKNKLENLCDNPNVFLIDSVLMQLKTNITIKFCKDRFQCILAVDGNEINTYEVCDPELIRWFGYALKEMADSKFVMSEERKRQFLSRMIAKAERES